jgi:hypothetical protein
MYIYIKVKGISLAVRLEEVVKFGQIFSLQFADSLELCNNPLHQPMLFKVGLQRRDKFLLWDGREVISYQLVHLIPLIDFL